MLVKVQKPSNNCLQNFNSSDTTNVLIHVARLTSFLVDVKLKLLLPWILHVFETLENESPSKISVLHDCSLKKKSHLNLQFQHRTCICLAPLPPPPTPQQQQQKALCDASIALLILSLGVILADFYIYNKGCGHLLMIQFRKKIKFIQLFLHGFGAI